MSLVGILKKLYSNEIVEDWKKYKQNPKKNPTREEHSIKKKVAYVDEWWQLYLGIKFYSVDGVNFGILISRGCF
jgi:hypothetical protein